MANGSTVLNDGLNVMLNRLFQATPDDSAMTVFRVGTGTTTPVRTDTTLASDVPLDSTTVDACDAVAGWSNAGIGDAELLNTTAGERKEGTGCLNLATTGAAGTASWNKNVASFDINDTGDTLNVWFYIVDASDLTTDADAVRITLGTSGLVNTNYYSFANTAISDGWNFLECANDGETGTEGTGADEEDVDYIELAVKLDSDQATNDMRMDFWHLATSSNYTDTFMTGYPTFSSANRTVTIRCNVPSTSSANGHSLSEVMIENTDSSIEGVSRTVHTAISKSGKDNVIYQNVYTGDVD